MIDFAYLGLTQDSLGNPEKMNQSYSFLFTRNRRHIIRTRCTE
jgi:hypothetical protein